MPRRAIQYIPTPKLVGAMPTPNHTSLANHHPPVPVLVEGPLTLEQTRQLKRNARRIKRHLSTPGMPKELIKGTQVFLLKRMG